MRCALDILVDLPTKIGTRIATKMRGRPALKPGSHIMFFIKDLLVLNTEH